MQDKQASVQEILNSLPSKQYFSIGEASEVCGVKPYVLRYWEKEFSQLNPLKRNKRRYYQREDIETVLELRDLLHIKRFTIKGARDFLQKRKSLLAKPASSTSSTEKIAGVDAAQEMVSQTIRSRQSARIAMGKIIRRLDVTVERLQTVVNKK